LGRFLNCPPTPPCSGPRCVRRDLPKCPYLSNHIVQGIVVLVALGQLGLLANSQIRVLLSDYNPDRDGRSRSRAYAQEGQPRLPKIMPAIMW